MSRSSDDQQSTTDFSLYSCSFLCYIDFPMNSRLIRVLIVVVGVAIVMSAAFLLRDLDSRIRSHESFSDALRGQARGLSATIADMRVGQVAYVANGQSEEFWMTHVATLLPVLQKQSAEFAAGLAAPASRSAFDAAVAALENFRTLDARVREFVTGGNGLLAGDLIFADGLESATAASSHLATALQEELQARANDVAQIQRRQLDILAGRDRGHRATALVACPYGYSASPGCRAAGDRAGHRAHSLRGAAAARQGGCHAEADHDRSIVRRAFSHYRKPSASFAARACRQGPGRIGHDRLGGRPSPDGSCVRPFPSATPIRSLPGWEASRARPAMPSPPLSVRGSPDRSG